MFRGGNSACYEIRPWAQGHMKSGLEFLLTRNSDVKKKGGNFPAKSRSKTPPIVVRKPPKAEIAPPDQVSCSRTIYVLRVRRASQCGCARRVSPRPFCPPRSNPLFG